MPFITPPVSPPVSPVASIIFINYISFLTIVKSIPFFHLSAWLHLKLLTATLAVIHYGLRFCLTACHQLRTNGLLSAILVTLRPIYQWLHAVKVLRLFNVWSLSAKNTRILLRRTIASTYTRYVLCICLLGVRVGKIVKVIVTRRGLETILVHTNRTPIIAEASCSCSVVIVKVFILIFNDYFLEYLMTCCSLTWRSLMLILLILDFLLDNFVLTCVKLAIHHGMVHHRISQPASTHAIKIYSIRILIFKSA